MDQRFGAVEEVDLTGLFNGVYRGRRVLVTGHTGFKGSWLALWLRELGAEVSGLALAPDTEPSHHRLLALGVVEALEDLRDAEAVRNAVERFRPEIVFHLAAQPLVRRSFREPVATVATNVMGLLHLLEAVRDCSSVRAVVNATTDKCYEVDGRRDGYAEEDRLGGFDAYSASKACAEILSSCWRRSFLGPGRADGRAPILLATARAGNVVGGGDWAEDRLVPDLVRAAAAGREAPVRNPRAVRPWQHVLEPLAGYLLLGQRLFAGDSMCASAWNFGPAAGGELSVSEIAHGLARHWPAVRMAVDAGSHPHETAELRLNWDKARRTLGWVPVWGARVMLERTAAWYRTYYESGRTRSLEDLQDFVLDAKRAGVGWAVH